MPEPFEHRDAPDLSDLDTARLALRGALESLRSLQGINERLRGDIQEYANRNKLLDQRMIELQTQLSATQTKLDHEEDNFKHREEALRRSIRQEVAIEENQRWQAEFASLRQTLEMWKLSREQKEAELTRIQTLLINK